jgi:hypothetical protein
MQKNVLKFLTIRTQKYKCLRIELISIRKRLNFNERLLFQRKNLKTNFRLENKNQNLQ